MTTFTISASGSRADVLSHLNAQRDGHENLKNRVLDNLFGYLRTIPPDASNFSVSVSGTVSYSLAAAAAPASPDPEITVEAPALVTPDPEL